MPWLTLEHLIIVDTTSKMIILKMDRDAARLKTNSIDASIVGTTRGADVRLGPRNIKVDMLVTPMD